MRGILRKIIYKGCLKDLCYLLLGILFYMSPVIAKFIADLLIYIEGI